MTLSPATPSEEPSGDPAIARNHQRNWFWLRIGIVFLRIIPIWGALWGVAALCDFAMGAPWTKGFITYSAPLQKRFFVPIVICFSSLLVLVPFIALRFTNLFRIYVTLFVGCLLFLAYDYLIPFRYVAPITNALVSDGGGAFGHFSIKDNTAIWYSNPGDDDLLLYVPFLGTLILAFIYRRYFLRWAAMAEHGAAL